MYLPPRCHYYDEEDNLGCTLGDWHPLAAEKLAALSLHSGNDLQVFRDGYITIKAELMSPPGLCKKYPSEEY